VDIGRSIQYVFQDPDWIKKVLIGGILMIIPIIGWMIVSGYYLRTVKNVIAGQDLPLPEWGDWGGDLVRGLKLIVVFLVWFAPVWILSCLLAIVSGVDETGFLGLLLNCIVFLFSIGITFMMPLFVSRFAAREEIGDAFQFADIIQEAQRIPGQLLIYVVLSYAISLVAGIGVILCVIGVVFTWFIAYLITGHLVGQIRRGLDATAPSAPTGTV
jgi:hypothetical protein